MRTRIAIATLCFLWVAAESRFSPSFFWQGVETSFSSAVAALDGKILNVEGNAVSAAPDALTSNYVLARTSE
ncbi:MAG: hypothetical protein H7X92_06205 [Chitinophagales bacterium]|nr:hypothetical protein [Hyphomicrobiales bacterium]